MADGHGVRIKGLRCQQCDSTFDGRGYSKFCSRRCVNESRRSVQQTHKACRRCREVKSIQEFGTHVRADRVQGKVYFSTYCLACRRATTRSEDTRRSSLKKRYGVTPEWFEETLARQGGCASCGAATTDGKYWHIDHDHSCCPSSIRTCGNCIRGILCHGCNTALGNLGDDPARVAALLIYIKGFHG